MGDVQLEVQGDSRTDAPVVICWKAIREIPRRAISRELGCPTQALHCLILNISEMLIDPLNKGRTHQGLELQMELVGSTIYQKKGSELLIGPGPVIGSTCFIVALGR
jgi:hypothetical protein